MYQQVVLGKEERAQRVPEPLPLPVGPGDGGRHGRRQLPAGERRAGPLPVVVVVVRQRRPPELLVRGREQRVVVGDVLDDTGLPEEVLEHQRRGLDEVPVDSVGRGVAGLGAQGVHEVAELVEEAPGVVQAEQGRLAGGLEIVHDECRGGFVAGVVALGEVL